MDDPSGRAGTEGGRPGSSATRRRRRARVAGVVVAVVVTGGATLVALGALHPAEAPAAPPEPVVLPSPTPTVAPVERSPLSPFADGLPSSVLAFALTGMAEETPLVTAGALEGYRLEYADGAGGTVTVLAGQWPAAADARHAFLRMVEADQPAGTPDDRGPTRGEVTVDGARAGAWALTRAAGGTAALTWTNGTALLRAVGPLDVVRDVHAAFPY